MFRFGKLCGFRSTLQGGSSWLNTLRSMEGLVGFRAVIEVIFLSTGNFFSVAPRKRWKGPFVRRGRLFFDLP
ncbi:hypothetical protein RB5851 [Rhodopirellula baltica SH 1]|uniref:Uncharacterized protein n=1 Tax=Rhodopirellula baltica (strain DSM 10527 / NCIMB 13988 / SH1) TaxID=243090 RepID=Q7UR71_RHOBA|nr:hypothetical protein RB5851 [Rhodopirellula baltica SH 1]